MRAARSANMVCFLASCLLLASLLARCCYVQGCHCMYTSLVVLTNASNGVIVTTCRELCYVVVWVVAAGVWCSVLHIAGLRCCVACIFKMCVCCDVS
jgi:hypothetical protein